MPQVQPSRQAEIVVDMMFEALRVEDATLNKLALRLLEGMGALFLTKLAKGASDITNKPRHRKRILQAIQRIGPGDDIRLHHEIFLLLSDENRAVRQAAKCVLQTIASSEQKVSPRIPSSFRSLDSANAAGWELTSGEPTK